jgi:hypothetical protein
MTAELPQEPSIDKKLIDIKMELLEKIAEKVKQIPDELLINKERIEKERYWCEDLKMYVETYKIKIETMNYVNIDVTINSTVEELMKVYEKTKYLTPEYIVYNSIRQMRKNIENIFKDISQLKDYAFNIDRRNTDNARKRKR